VKRTDERPGKLIGMPAERSAEMISSSVIAAIGRKTTTANPDESRLAV
jgi:hypothetical protein